jgi:hypothetical protein
MAGDDADGGVESLRVEGGTALAIGDVPETAHRSFGRAVLGGRDRRRLLVLAGRPVEAAPDYLPEGTARTPATLRVVEHDLSTRSAATDGGDAGAPGGVDPSTVVTVPGDDLPALGVAVSEGVDAFEAVVGDLGPGELGLCFDSLWPVVAEHGDAEVLGFLHVLLERLRRVDAAAAVHLPVAREDRIVGLFGSLFDAVVELRVDGDRLLTRFDRGDGPGEWRAVDG